MQINISLKWVLLTLWIIFSIAYIWWDLYSEIRYKAMNAAYTQWQTDVVTSLFKEIENVGCQKPVTVNLWAQKVDLINVQCLQWQAQSSQSSVGTWANPAWN